MDYKVTVESDEKEVAWWVVVNGERVGMPWAGETTAWEVKEWLDAFGPQPALPQIAQAAGYVLMQGGAVPHELPVLGTVGASKYQGNVDGEVGPGYEGMPLG